MDTRDKSKKIVDDPEQLPDELQPEYLNSTFKKKWRWVMLVLCSNVVVANYFSYDNPGSLELQMEEEIENGGFGVTET